MDLIDLQLLGRSCDRLSVDLPERTAQALAVYHAANEAAAAQPADDLRAAFDRGELDPSSVGQVLRDAAVAQNARQSMGALVQDLQLPVVRAAVAALREDGDRLVAEMRGPFDAAATGMTTAAGLFAPGADAEQVLASEPEAAAAWSALDAHRDVLDAVHSVRLDLAQVGYGPHDPHVSFYVADVADEVALQDAAHAYDDSTGRGGRWHRLAGVTRLHLNTADQAARVIATARAGSASRVEAQRQRELEAARRAAAPYVAGMERLVVRTTDDGPAAA